MRLKRSQAGGCSDIGGTNFDGDKATYTERSNSRAGGPKALQRRLPHRGSIALVPLVYR